MLRSAVSTAARSVSQARYATTLSAGFPKVIQRGPTKYGGVYTVTLIPGDGVGAEITDSVKEIFEAVNAPIEWDQYNVSGMSPCVNNLTSTASVVLCKSLPGFPTRHSNGEYSGLEHQSYPGVVESLKVSTRMKAERIARFAFDFAAEERTEVTCVHKANIMKLGDGLFLNTFRQVAEEYKSSGIIANDMIVDNTSMQLVAKPGQFDVMVMPNLYGAIVSNIGAALVGGPGIVPGCNVGREYALFEPGCRHVAKDLMGTNKANPTAMILSATMMLRHLGLDHLANSIASATFDVIDEGNVRTADMGGE
ncbi:hypothetical protein DFH11DRAFT_1774620 [Phellopilus nigrolimitatus]|nr:hypothetical protein DFH11DRAFT_1774620 [Phellopilus nigrolimitatus]